MEGFGIEISAVGPLNRPKRRVELYGIEQRQVLERSEHLSFQDGPEIDPLLAAIVELERDRVRVDDVEVRDAMDGVAHGIVSRSTQWVNLEWWLAGLQERPVLQQFFPMDFCPSLDKSLLSSRECAADTLDWVQREHGLGLLVGSMEVSPMVR